MLYVIMLAISVLAIAFILAIAASRPGDQPSEYVARGYLLTKAESAFLRLLDDAAGPEIRVFAQVRVADVLKTKPGLSKSARASAFGRISQKHFDFVLCDAAQLTIQAVVELDDRSHQKPHRIKRDQLLNTVCEQAGLALLRFPVNRNNTVQSVRDVLHERLSAPKLPAQEQLSGAEASA